MNKQDYHKPEFRMYGNISVMTQAMGRMDNSAADGGGGTLQKTS